MTNLLADVEHKDDPVLCPKCGEKAQKTDDPLKPMPPDPPNAKMATVYLGQAYCEECDDTFPWCYRGRQLPRYRPGRCRLSNGRELAAAQ